MQIGTPPGSATRDLSPPAPGAHAALALLLLINLFNYIDRQILSAVLKRLELDGSLFSPTDPDVQFKLGLLTSAFLVSYMLFSPLVGWLDGHGYRRWWILGLGVSIWSLASGCSGFATGYWVLFLTRCLVGIGEGAYAPVASAMLSDAYPPRHRGTVLAIFNLAIPVGSALGFVIGGAVSDHFDDWRPAFWVTFSGLLLGLVCFARRELPRGSTSAQQANAPSYWQVLGLLRRNRSFVLCCIGMTAITYVLGGVAAFAPAYVFEREARFVLNAETLHEMEHPPKKTLRKPVPPEVIARLQTRADGEERDLPALKKHLEAELQGDIGTLYFASITAAATTRESPSHGSVSMIFGAMVVLGGITATSMGTWLAERLRPRLSGAYFWVIGGGALAAWPAFVGFLYLPLPLGWGALFLAVVGLFMHVGPGNTILANVVTTNIRATAFAINILVIHALGDVISPLIIGWTADRSSMQLSLLITSGMIAVAAVLWFAGASGLDRKMAEAAAADAGKEP